LPEDQGYRQIKSPGVGEAPVTAFADEPDALVAGTQTELTRV